MSKVTEKKEIMTELNDFVDKYQLEGSIDAVLEYVKSLPKIAKDRYPQNNQLQNAHRFAIRMDSESDYEGGYYSVFHLQYFRWETDKEFETRLETNRKQKLAAIEREKNKKLGKEKREKTLYENLKKKFEGA